MSSDVPNQPEQPNPWGEPQYGQPQYGQPTAEPTQQMPQQGGWGAPAQQMPQQGAWGAPTQPAPQPGGDLGSDAKGLMGALFDLSFRHYATPKIVRIAYILCLVMVGLTAVGMVLGAFGMMAEEEVGLGFLVLLLTPLVSIVYLAIIRMSLEMYVALTRMADDLGRLREELRQAR
ncbi:MAG: DUF4282 domain-containing protein [Luteococcus japonicus]|uniref:DUF4282 domain-containing protein n=1 Tax=Luteococcus sp. TaxID=1969402 RepID=UPI0026487CCA|nr:DUF4282 domain-containing protein [Luteococcus sp.]MDN5564373.1 DUF4282 domain-containing protein [Luteococcus sp.]